MELEKIYLTHNVRIIVISANYKSIQINIVIIIVFIIWIFLGGGGFYFTDKAQQCDLISGVGGILSDKQFVYHTRNITWRLLNNFILEI